MTLINEDEAQSLFISIHHKYMEICGILCVLGSHRLRRSNQVGWTRGRWVL